MEKDKTKFGKHLVIVLKEMCKRVNAKFEDIDFCQDDWFRQYEWTEQGQKDFEKWLADHIYSNEEARQELTIDVIKDERLCKEFAALFCSNYGWKFS